MTPAELSALPDAEVNRLVALELGWQEIHSREEFFNADAATVFWVEDGGVKYQTDRLGGAWRWFNPCRDWYEAGRLWEHCVGSGYTVRMEQPGESSIWLDQEPEPDSTYRFSDNPNPLRALCEAYLLAKGAG